MELRGVFIRCAGKASCSDVKEVVCLLFSLGREGVKECGISDIGAKLDEPGILA